MSDDPSPATIRQVFAGEVGDLNAFMVALSERPAGDGFILLIQRSLEDDPQDAALGMDTYALTNEMGTTVYGGVRGYSLTGHHLHLSLERSAAEALGTPGELDLVLEVPEADLRLVTEGLNRLLG